MEAAHKHQHQRGEATLKVADLPNAGWQPKSFLASTSNALNNFFRVTMMPTLFKCHDLPLFVMFYIDLLRHGLLSFCMPSANSWKKRRVRLGFRKEELARKAGISSRTIMRLESGYPGITEETKSKVRIALGR